MSLRGPLLGAASNCPGEKMELSVSKRRNSGGFQSEVAVLFDGKDDDVRHLPIHSDKIDVKKMVSDAPRVIKLRDYQELATRNCLRDLENHRSALIVLATGLGKTILFCELVHNWKGRVLVLAHLEELLQNARDDLMTICGEPVGIERGKDHHEGERIVVGLIQSVSKRLKHFRPKHFSLIIVDEAHRASSEAYSRVFKHFATAKVVGLTATDGRTDGDSLPFESCSYRMGIREGIDQGYLVPVRGKRVTLKSVNLSRVKRTGLKEDGDFDERALDSEMVKEASAIADILCEDYPWEKGILFFPGCASAKLCYELLNEREPDSAVYIDGNIVGAQRRELVNKLRNGGARWLCNVGIAVEGFNWPEASVVGMCKPTFSRLAYTQMAGRGTRPLAGLLNGWSTPSERKAAISASNKPSMLILDFQGVSAVTGLVDSDNFLDDPKPKPLFEESEEESFLDEPTEEDYEPPFVGPNLNLRAIAKHTESKTLHEYDEFDPFEETGQQGASLSLTDSRIGAEPSLSYAQYRQLKRNGIDDESLTKSEAQKLIQFIASKGWKLWAADLGLLKKLHKDIRASRSQVDDGEGFV